MEISIKNDGIGYRYGMLATPSHMDFCDAIFWMDGVDDITIGDIYKLSHGFIWIIF